MKNKPTSRHLRRAAALALLLASAAHLQAQETGAASAQPDATVSDESEIVVLSPFEVSAAPDQSYTAATTLAGNRLNTEVRDIGSAVQIVTSVFLRDTAATDNATLLQYTTNTEVGGSYGNFAGAGDGARLTESFVRPNENTRIRGLAAADNTRDFFRSEIPWDGYNVDRVDLQRGPNSILFGQGSPAGIINAGTKSAAFTDSGEVEARYGSYNSWRFSVDVNKEIIDDQLAVRFDLLHNDQNFRQEPAFSKDQRLYGALRADPAFLRKNGAHTIFKASFETGEIDSNNPRQLPPTDNITPWFTDLNQATYSGAQLWDHLSGRINHGQARSGDYAAPGVGPIPYSSPWLVNGNFGTSGGTEPVAFFGGDGAPALWITEVSAQLQNNGIGPNGQVDNDIQGFVANPGRMRGINGTALWAVQAGMPYSAAGIHKDNLITDSSTFNFYENLIDGDTKGEWQDFDTANFNLTQTFMDDTFGVSLDYNDESYEAGQVALLGGNVGLFIDPMSVFADGTPDAGQTGDPYANGTRNPNVGRPFVSSTGGSNFSFLSEREAMRATAFVAHDFARGERTWLNRILGSQRITGLWADEQQETDNRSWQRYGYLDGDTAYRIQHLNPATNTFAGTGMVPTSIVYLGSALQNQSIAGAKIPRVHGQPTLPNSTVRYFDDRWRHPLDPAAAGYVNPAAAWTNYFFTADTSLLAPGQPGNASAMNSTQSENPANYVGWTNAQLNVTDSESSAANRDLLTTSASLRKSATESKAFVWQGKLLDGSLVGTFGWRNDVNESWAHDAQVSGNATLPGGASNPNYKHIDFDAYSLPSGADGRVEVDSHAYSVVAHLSDIPGLASAMKKLPFEVSVFYSESTNFKPDASRVDILGERIAPPSGKTTDKGVTIATHDGRYSLKINRYETAMSGASGAGSYQIGYDIGNWFGHGAIYANVFEYDIGNWEWARSPSNYQQGNAMRFDYFVNNLPDDSDNEARAIAGYREFQRGVDPRFWAAWGYQSLEHAQSGEAIDTVPSGGAVHVPAGFTLTEDSVSEGWEFEFNASPLENWRVTLNASQSEAVRTNIGGDNMRTLMDHIVTSMEGDAGLLHFWWGTHDVPRARAGWYNFLNNPGVQWVSRSLLEGANVPELRQWRVNLISNYDFRTGALKGVNVGGAMRYQSAVDIGYPPAGDPTDPADYSIDLAHPYQGPSENEFDFWVGYSRKLTERVDWNIQLNIRNAFGGDDLIPITVQGPIAGQNDGTPAAYRIAPARTFFLTNRFTF